MDSPNNADVHVLGSEYQSVKKQLAFASRYLSLAGQDDFNQGQLSARSNVAERFFIKKAICGFAEAHPDDFIECHSDTTSMRPKEAPPELPLHQAIYRARPDVKAIVHTHSESAIVFAALGLTLKPISHDACCFINCISVFSETTHTILADSTAEMVAQALGSNCAVFLQNHGIVVVANSIRRAAILTSVLDRACRMQLAAEAISSRYAVSSVEDIEAKRRYIYSDTAIRTYWDYAKTLVRQQWPETSAWQ